MLLTKQQLLEAIDKMEKQKCLSRNDNGCFYDAGNGVNCIVGKLMTPEQRKIGDDEPSDSSIEHLNSKYKWFDEKQAEDILIPLQGLHDEAVDIESFVEQARELVNAKM